MTKPNLAVITGKQYIYTFEEGDGKNKMLLGGKGANLCEMTQIGLNVPPGFTITTDACLAYFDKNQLPAGLTGEEMESAVLREAVAIPRANVLVEPVGRDTSACIGWAAWRLAESHPGAVMVVLPVDHRIPDGAALRKSLAAAAAAAYARGGLVTLGVRPDRPDRTGFGYLELGEAAGGAGGLPVMRVKRFVEKPDRQQAESMLAAGNYRWNAGIFAWTVEAIRDAIRQHLPDLAEGLDGMMKEARQIGEAAAARWCFADLPRVSIDFGAGLRYCGVYTMVEVMKQAFPIAP